MVFLCKEQLSKDFGGMAGFWTVLTGSASTLWVPDTCEGCELLLRCTAAALYGVSGTTRARGSGARPPVWL